jgi:hypothetical protein
MYHHLDQNSSFHCGYVYYMYFHELSSSLNAGTHFPQVPKAVHILSYMSTKIEIIYMVLKLYEIVYHHISHDILLSYF